MSNKWDETIEKWKKKQLAKLYKSQEEGVSTMVIDEEKLNKEADEQLEEQLVSEDASQQERYEKQLEEISEAVAKDLTTAEQEMMQTEEPALMPRPLRPPPPRPFLKKPKFHIFADEDLDSLEERMNEYFEDKETADIIHVSTSQHRDMVTIVVTYKI